MEIYDDVFHCWQVLDGVVPEARLALTRAAEFIRSQVSRTDQRATNALDSFAKL